MTSRTFHIPRGDDDVLYHHTSPPGKSGDLASFIIFQGVYTVAPKPASRSASGTSDEAHGWETLGVHSPPWFILCPRTPPSPSPSFLKQLKPTLASPFPSLLFLLDILPFLPSNSYRSLLTSLQLSSVPSLSFVDVWLAPPPFLPSWAGSSPFPSISLAGWLLPFPPSLTGSSPFPSISGWLLPLSLHLWLAPPPFPPSLAGSSLSSISDWLAAPPFPSISGWLLPFPPSLAGSSPSLPSLAGSSLSLHLWLAPPPFPPSLAGSSPFPSISDWLFSLSSILISGWLLPLSLHLWLALPLSLHLWLAPPLSLHLWLAPPLSLHLWLASPFPSISGWLLPLSLHLCWLLPLSSISGWLLLLFPPSLAGSSPFPPSLAGSSPFPSSLAPSPFLHPSAPSPPLPASEIRYYARTYTSTKM
ncbi:hypothetical protein C7M84_007047 [Penaeus vannamei]|uniref:Uncharacterized protein n=1 Tax=Penaeus vannamei TaxID=6689 RepID=A0A3R7M7V7_PENVA|nr:hypothetical protein C7M84_007047 [Penaeus vannamei]